MQKRFKVQAFRNNQFQTVDHLGQDELDQWMGVAYGRWATVRVIEETTGKTVTYTDDGEWGVKVKVEG